MKNFKLILNVLVVVTSFMFFQCTSDYTPIPGPAGADGAQGLDGADGVDGADGGNTCLKCHNSDYKVIQNSTYLSSGHDIAAALAGRGGACLNCHSNEGYIASVALRDLTTSYVTGTATKITCSTCHSGGHTSAGVAVSGTDAALRAAGSYQLVGVGTSAPVIDYGNNSNNCIHCHQVRRAGAGYVANSDSTSPNFGKVAISGSYGPHYGGAVTLLEGIDANLIAGSTAYPTAGSNPHRTGASCVSCHMGSESGGLGNHSFKPVLENCKKCHTGAGVVSYDINGGQTVVKNLMKDLAKEIVRLYPANFSLTTGSADPKDDGMLVMPSSSVQIPERVAKAVYNYRFLYQDHSYGLHNPTYAKALMNNSIADLKLIP